MIKQCTINYQVLTGFKIFQVLYCDGCRELCHPNRGPLATHNLGPAQGSYASLSRSNGPRANGLENGLSSCCVEHTGELLSLYCALCKVAACGLCLRDRHTAHPQDVLPLAAACKAQKVNIIRETLLSRTLRSKFSLNLKRYCTREGKVIIGIDTREMIRAVYFNINTTLQTLV